MGHSSIHILHHFTEYAQMYGYFGIFIWFLLIDEIVPLPDELPLITIGYLCATGVFNHPLLAALSAFLAFLIIDIISFIIAWKGSKWAEKIERRIKAKWLEQYKNGIRTRLPETLFVLSFIPRMRAFAPLLAGTVRVPPRRFFIYDSLSLALFIAVYISLGFYFHDQALDLFTHIERNKQYLFAGLLVILLGIFLYIASRFYRKGMVFKSELS